jgi:CHAD domain-containing protein
MAGAGVRLKSFERKYEEKTRGFAQFVGDLPERPAPEAIHDLRVAARRAQVISSLLPKEARRTKEARRFVLTLESVLKATSEVRDADTLKTTLEQQRNLLPAQLLVSLDNERSDAAARAWKEVQSLGAVSAPVLDPSQLSGKKLRRRVRKRIEKRREAMPKLLKTVLGDESATAELHSLRKEAKKMRYLLELTRDQGEVRTLIRWQDALGAVHDLDVAVGYLQGSHWDFPKEPVLRELRNARHSKYVKFARDYEMEKPRKNKREVQKLTTK